MDDKKNNNDVKDESLGDDYGAEEGGTSSSDDEYGPAFLSLHRLKSESNKLQARWSRLEDDLLARDAVIAQLNAELELSQANFTSLQDEVDAGDEQREKMDAEIAAANREIKTSQQRIDERARELEMIGKQIEDANVAHEKAVAETGSLQAELRKQRQLTADTNVQVISRDTEINKLHSTIQDLEVYIDCRKENWEKLNIELADYRNTLIGVEKIVRSREAYIHEREDEKRALARSIIELEQQIAELDGRRAERELMNEQLQTRFDERGQQIDEERAISGALREERDDLLQQSAGLEHVLEQERSRVDSLQALNADAQSSLAAANAKVATLEGKLTRQQQQLDDIEQKYDEHQVESVELRTELKQARDSLVEAEQRLSASDTKAAEFDVESTVFMEEIAMLRDTLIAKNQLVATLEAELTARKETIALLDHNVRRLSNIGDDAQALDEQIARETRLEEHTGQSAQSGSVTTRLMVAMTGEQWIKYPLYKESTTIGRSTDNDIQLRWKYISRNHARIVCRNTGTKIEDLGSKNGIYVNNEPGRSFELHDGDRVEIGEVQFEYIDLEEQHAAAAPQD